MASQLRIRSHLLGEGARALGWKAGFGSADAMARFSTDGPLVGFLTDRSLVESGASCSLEGWTNPLLEIEVASHIVDAVPRHRDREGVEARIGGLGVAIEIVDVDTPALDVETILSGNIYHRKVILGPAHPCRLGGSARGLTAHLILNGATVGEATDVESLSGAVVDVVGHVRDVVTRSGASLQSGEVVICGAIVAPIRVHAGDLVEATIDPLGTLSVRFT
jgi:2-keto-4-pentenoate hydratase